jgi:CBS domain-containing protein
MNAPNQSIEETVEQLPVEVIPPSPIEPEDEKTNAEEFTISGSDLVDKVKELIHEGNVRRIVIKNEEGRILIEIPLTVGVVGGVLSAALFPVVAAVGVIGATVAHLTLVIEKKE